MLLCMGSGCAELAKKTPNRSFFACFITKVKGWHGESRGRVYCFTNVETSFFLLELISAYFIKKKSTADEVATQ